MFCDAGDYTRGLDLLYRGVVAGDASPFTRW